MSRSLSPLDTRLDQFAKHHSVDPKTIRLLSAALQIGRGAMAQFDAPELGGAGQWIRDGMTMAGDMKQRRRIETLFEALLPLWKLESTAMPAQFDKLWWGEDLGIPVAGGSQNAARYAIFPEQQRLAIEHHGDVTIYDTLDHIIVGVSQQQGRPAALALISQHGTIDLHTLSILSRNGTPVASSTDIVATSQTEIRNTRTETWKADTSLLRASPHDILRALEKLGELRDKNVLTESEFSAKKIE